MVEILRTGRIKSTFIDLWIGSTTSAATRVLGQTGDTYLAGRWKRDLSLGLLWDAEHPSGNPSSRKFDWELDLTKPPQCAAEYRAPPWS